MNVKEKFINKKRIYVLVLFIAYIQLPVLLIQRYFYDFLIKFNLSGQSVAPFDFLFGTFFLKSDHSLGFFLLSVILCIIFNIDNAKTYVKFPIITTIYLSGTLLLTESNISKGLLILAWVIIITRALYRKLIKDRLFRKIIGITALILGSVALYNLKDIKLITSRLGGTIENNFTIAKSYKFFREGTAKREQVVISAIYKIDTKLIGDGPYSYFDITTGKFKNTIHFSQIIWAYFDLGVLGLIVVFIYMYYIIKSLKIRTKEGFIGLLLLSFIYLFYTTPFSEIGILFSLLLLYNQTENEHNYHSIPRLEKK